MTALLRSRRRRLRAEREAERVYALSPALLAVAGFDGYLRRFNPAFDVFGYSREELLSRPWIEFAHPDDRERMAQAAASLAGGAAVVDLTNRVVCRDGSVRWIEWSTRVVEEDGLFYAAGRDVTEAHRAAVEQGALRRVATLVAQETAPHALLAAVSREVGEVLDVDATHLGRYEEDRAVVSVAQWGRYPTVPAGARFPLDGDSVSARVQHTGRPARMDGYQGVGGVIAATLRELGIHYTIGAPIVVAGRTWGIITATSKDRPFPPETEARLQRFTDLVGTAIANAHSRQELTASRARVLLAGDEARRRLVRDLHDGAQQPLVHTIMTLKLGQHAIRAGRGDPGGLVDESLSSAERAIRELRELSHGILPAALHDGLRTAIAAFASRLELPVDTEVSEVRLPADIERSAYFIDAEALTNAVKHAQATRANVRVSTDDGVLTIEVRDDGVGGADPDGHGLMGIADRAAALDGELFIRSPVGEGTTVVVTVPLRAQPMPSTTLP
jgi:PAS domain S-box-containing protein